MPYNPRRLLETIEDLAATKQFLPIQRLCDLNPRDSRDLVALRCDVERNLKYHLALAKRLAGLGISCTMYFHTRQGCYDADLLHQIRDHGHEIGYHHECLDRCRGDFAAARELFLREVDWFCRDGLSVMTVCAHGESGLPKNGYRGNSDLFERYPGLLEEAGVRAEVYQKIISRWDPVYASDTFVSYRHFWSRIAEGRRSRSLLMILIHLHRWARNPVLRLWESGRDIGRRYRNKLTRRKTYRTILD